MRKQMMVFEMDANTDSSEQHQIEMEKEVALKALSRQE